MSIWFKEVTVAELNLRNSNTMSDFLDIKFTEAGEDFLVATMPVNDKTKQPVGILHGGASVVLAETVGSVAANYTLDFSQCYAVGLDINANHIKSKRDGLVTATAKPVHIGRNTQVWQIKIVDEQQNLICISRLTMAILDRK